MTETLHYIYNISLLYIVADRARRIVILPILMYITNNLSL